MATTAELIDRTAKQSRQTLRNSASLGIQSALDELSAIWQECQSPGWDGFGARAVERRTLASMYSLIDSLPFGFPLPSISAQPDGQLTVEWYRTPTRNLSISVDPDGLVHYAGLFGVDRHHGTVAFFDGMPQELLRLAAEV